MRRLSSNLIYVLSGALGVFAFLYPFFAPQNSINTLQSQIAPLLTAALVGFSLLALLVEIQGQTLNAKTIALMGILVAVTSTLRFIEVAIPLPGGFSPIFAPIILVGYVFGARFGFLMGTLTMLTSALLTGGIGPWLPFQMFTAGWAGLTAGWLPQLPKRWELPVLCVFGFVWGLLYGAIINLYFWPLAQGPADQSWTRDLNLADTLARYASFYLVTSLAWDLIRAVGNVALLLLLSAPTLKILARFRQRFHFEVGADG